MTATLGVQIEAARRARDMAANGLAGLLRVGTSHLRAIEQGRRVAAPSLVLEIAYRLQLDGELAASWLHAAMKSGGASDAALEFLGVALGRLAGGECGAARGDPVVLRERDLDRLSNELRRALDRVERVALSARSAAAVSVFEPQVARMRLVRLASIVDQFAGETREEKWDAARVWARDVHPSTRFGSGRDTCISRWSPLPDGRAAGQLSPRVGRKGARIHPRAWRRFLALMIDDRRSLTATYRGVAAEAKVNRWDWPSQKAVARRWRAFLADFDHLRRRGSRP